MAGIFGAITSAIGGLIGGASRKKAAQKAENKADQLRDEAGWQRVRDIEQVHALVQATDSENVRRRNEDVAELRGLMEGDQARWRAYASEDQARAIEYARADEVRLEGKQGVDFEALVRDARAAGFNPLTALAAAGTGAYDRINSFISTPFIGMADKFIGMAESFIGRPQYDQTPLMNAIMSPSADTSGSVGAAMAKAGTAGYWGDVIGGFGQNMIGISQENARMKQDAELAGAQLRAYGEQSAGSGYISGPVRSGSFAPVSSSDARPGLGYGTGSNLGGVDVNGMPMEYTPGEAVSGHMRLVLPGASINLGGADGEVWGFDEWGGVLMSTMVMPQAPGTWEAIEKMATDHVNAKMKEAVTLVPGGIADNIWNRRVTPNYDHSAWNRSTYRR